MVSGLFDASRQSFETQSRSKRCHAYELLRMYSHGALLHNKFIFATEPTMEHMLVVSCSN